MPHDIEIIEGRASFFTHKEPAWHGLGQVVQDATTIEQAIELAGLDWTVSLEPVYATLLTADGATVMPVEDRYAVVRQHPWLSEPNVLGLVGSRYEVHTPLQAAKFLDALLGLGVQVETAGSLSNGKRVFITMRLPKGILVNGKDRIDLYSFFQTSFDGSTQSTIDLTTVRVVCANTARLAQTMSEKRYQVRHTASLDGRAFEARMYLDMAFEYMDAFQEEAERLLNTSLRDEDFADFLNDLIPMPPSTVGLAPSLWSPAETRAVNRAVTQRREIAFTYLTSETMSEYMNTAWGAWNAVTEWADWMSPTRAATDEARNAKRAQRILMGDNETIKDKAFALLTR